MHLFEIVSVEPLEPHGDLRYSSIASDGTSMLFLERTGPSVVRHCGQLKFLEQCGAARAYAGICFDDVDKCFWGCCSQSSNVVYRLSGSFREVDRFVLWGYDPCLGAVKGIAYDKQEDCLILTFANAVLTVDKHSFAERAVSHCICAQTYQCCIRSLEYHYYAGWQCSAQTLSIAKDGQLIVHACLPPGHRIVGMAETCAEGGPVINILSVKQGKYHYLLKGVLVCGRHLEAQAADCTAPVQPTGKAVCCKPLGRDCSEEPPDQSHKDCCPQDVQPCGEANGAHRKSGCRPHHREQDCIAGAPILTDSCASIMESIALEQTALSHILNAEGEKIQKAVAIASDPADLLEVNQSVEELITRVIHLEQVLYAKLELACGVLRGAGKRYGDGP